MKQLLLDQSDRWVEFQKISFFKRSCVIIFEFRLMTVQGKCKGEKCQNCDQSPHFVQPRSEKNLNCGQKHRILFSRAAKILEFTNSN
jgi:hypothetical protein